MPLKSAVDITAACPWLLNRILHVYICTYMYALYKWKLLVGKILKDQYCVKYTKLVLTMKAFHIHLSLNQVHAG